MKTPIIDFVKDYSSRHSVRLHMPGHKGKSFLGCEELDITEIAGADTLYSADGIINESENNAAALFGTYQSFYSTEGSTLAIKAMLAIAVSAIRRGEGERPLILAARNVHKSFVNACALLDLDVDWLFSERSEHLCRCIITAERVSDYLDTCKTEGRRMPNAVYLTSPDYLGNIADIKGISTVCDRFDVPLLVDNAHGAYLAFLEPSLHPIALGASMCADSAHKTLPVLTGGAYLHIAEKYKEKYRDNARSKLSLFASTSPSYLLLQSLDGCNRYLSDGYRERLAECVSRVDALKEKVKELGFDIEDTEPLKLVINAENSGTMGGEIAEHLRRFDIELEFADDDFAVFMITPENTQKELDALVEALSSFTNKTRKRQAAENIIHIPKRVISVRDAVVLSDSESVSVDNSEGRICASPTVSCPPAVPIAVSGELIDREVIQAFKRYGIDRVEVVK